MILWAIKKTGIQLAQLIVLSGVLMENAFAVDINLDNSLYMGAWSPFASYYELQVPVCVWTDELSASYRIVAANAGAVGDFNLENGTGNTLEYNVFWQDDYNPLAWNQLTADAASSDTYLFDITEECGGGTNTAMRLEVEKSNFDNTAAGIYSGSIVLTLLPQ